MTGPRWVKLVVITFHLRAVIPGRGPVTPVREGPGLVSVPGIVHSPHNDKLRPVVVRVSGQWSSVKLIVQI